MQANKGYLRRSIMKHVKIHEQLLGHFFKHNYEPTIAIMQYIRKSIFFVCNTLRQLGTICEIKKGKKNRQG